MTKKDYLEPTVEVVEMGYRDPVCQAMSGDIPNYGLLDNSDIFDSIL